MAEELSPTQERAVRLALRCANLSKQLDNMRHEVDKLNIALTKALIQMERVGVTLELEDADREERSA